jgi:hypothetical protein
MRMHDSILPLLNLTPLMYVIMTFAVIQSQSYTPGRPADAAHQVISNHQETQANPEREVSLV